MKYIRIITKIEVEALTYDELNEIGKTSTEYNGYQIKQDGDAWYVTVEPDKTCKVVDQKMLVFGGRMVYVCDALSFERMYDKV